MTEQISFCHHSKINDVLPIKIIKSGKILHYQLIQKIELITNNEIESKDDVKVTRHANASQMQIVFVILQQHQIMRID